MYAFKGFESDLKCRGFQYEPGKLITMDSEPILCHKGFHACVLPIHVLRFYPPINGTRYRFVKLDGVSPIIKGTHFDSKVCGNQIIIGSFDVENIVEANMEVITSITSRLYHLANANSCSLEMLEMIRLLPKVCCVHVPFNQNDLFASLMSRDLYYPSDVFWTELMMLHSVFCHQAGMERFTQFIEYLTEDVKELFQ